MTNGPSRTGVKSRRNDEAQIKEFMLMLLLMIESAESCPDNKTTDNGSRDDGSTERAARSEELGMGQRRGLAFTTRLVAVHAQDIASREINEDS